MHLRLEVCKLLTRALMSCATHAHGPEAIYRHNTEYSWYKRSKTLINIRLGVTIRIVRNEGFIL